IIRQQQAFDVQSIQRKLWSIFNAAEDNMQNLIVCEGKIDEQIIIQIAKSNMASGRPCAVKIGLDKGSGPLLGKEQRSLFGARREYAGYIFVIPILGRDLLNTSE